MARQEFRDSMNRSIGWRQKQGPHDVGYDNLGRIWGYYEPINNITKHRNRMLVSRCNTLGALILAR